MQSKPDYDLVVFDASNAIHRISAANPPLNNRAGERVEIIFGLLRLLSSVLRDNTTNQTVLVWDTKTSRLLRQKVYTDYKAHRDSQRSPADKERIEGIYPQVDRFWAQFGKHLPVTWVESPMYEADDIMAMYAHEAVTTSTNTLIVTGDKDILQCVNEYCAVYSPNRKDKCTLDNFQSYTGGYPTCEAYLLGKCLMGDSGDNIPGIPGIGEKRALSILKDHEFDLYAIQNEPTEALTKSVWGKELAKPSSWARIALNWKLMCLCAPVHKVLRTSRLTVKKGTMDTKELRLSLAKNQFASIMADWTRWIQPFETMERYARTTGD